MYFTLHHIYTSCVFIFTITTFIYRPDPTPEIQVVDAGFSAPVGKGGLAFAPWRYNQEN